MRSLKEVGALAAAESFGRGASWLTLFALPWVLSTTEYGVVVLIATFEGVATGFLLLGQDRAVLWRYADRADPGSDRSAVGVAVLTSTVACILAFSLGSSAAAFTGGSLLGVPAWPHLAVLALAVILANANRIALAFARIARRTRDFAVNRMAVGAMRLAVTLGIGVATGSSLSYPIGIAIGTGLGGSPLWRRVFPRPLFERTDVAREAGVMLRYGAPLSVHLLAMSCIRFVDRWVIGAMFGLAVVGSYGWYYMLGSAVVFMYAALSVYYEPEIYREQLRGSGGRTVVREYLGTTLVAAGAYGLMGSLAAVFGGALVPASVQADPEIVRVVLIAYWLHPIYLCCNYLLSAVARTGTIAIISAIAVLGAGLATVVLVPPLGAIGGAWATLIGSLSLASAAMIVVRRTGIKAALFGPFVVVASLGGGALLLPETWSLAAASCGLVAYGAHLSGLIPRRSVQR